MAYAIGKQGTATLVAALRFYAKNADQISRKSLYENAAKELAGPEKQMTDPEIIKLANILLDEYCTTGYVD
jgi:hypothetical protein